MFSLLYVDDEPGLLELGKLFLESSGDFTVTTVMSGSEGLLQLAERRFDAIIADYQMPEMDGIEFLKNVRQSYGTIPFILFTGRGREEVVIEAINNGADFYLQKGGDPKAQFAELAHKIRQAVSRRRAELALSDSEKRLTDLINFLPDATFAIDSNRTVIAWNRAIEEMTGIAASDIVGKGNYEYSLPFYGTRRPILIDLIFEPEETVGRFYSNIRREGNTISAETDLPHPKGNPIYVLAKASPLFDSDGKITGAIEAIRDITDRKKAEEELRAVNEELAASGEELRAQYDELAEGERRIRESETRLNYMIGFYEYTQEKERDLLSYAIEGAGIITDSPLAYLAFLNDDESELSMYAWSKSAMAECSIQEKPILYKTEKTGLWGEAVRQRKPVITNDYEAPNPQKRGYPEGHPRIIRHMNVPIIDQGHIVIVAGVANKPSDYTEHDAGELTLLMQGLWTILKRKRAEQTRRESEGRYRKIIDNSPIGMHFYELKPDGSLVLAGANPGADAIMNVKNAQFIGKTIETAFPGFINTEVPAQYRRVAAEGGIWQADQVFYNTGKIHVAHAVTAFQVSPGFMVAMFSDVTERKTTEAALRESEERYRILMEHAFDGVLIQDPAGKILSVNPSLQRIVSIPAPATMTGRSIFDFIPSEYHDTLVQDLRNIQAGKGGYIQTYRIRTPDGKDIWIECVGTKIQYNGEDACIIAVRDITDRKMTADALQTANEQLLANEQELKGQIETLAFTQKKIRESEVKYRMLVEVNQDIIYSLSFDGIIQYISPQITDRLGYLPEELSGHTFMEFIHPEDVDMLVRHFTENIRAGTPAGSDRFRIRGKNGQYRWFEDKIIYTKDIGGLPVAIGTIRDITEEKAAQDAVAESKRKFQAIFDNASQFICLLTKDGTLIEANHTALAFVRPTESDVINRPLWEAAWWSHSAEARERLKEAIREAASGKSVQFDTTHSAADGSLAEIDFSITPVTGTTGSIQYLVAEGRDITSRKRVEEALRESEEKHRLIAENSPDMIYFIDTRGYLRYANSQAAKILRARPESIVGKHLSELFTPKLAKRFLKVIHRVIDTRIPFRREVFEEFPPMGSWIDIRLVPVSDASGKTLGVLGLSHDISDRKRAEEALRESEMKYRALVENTHDIIYTLSPDGILTFVSPSWTTLLGHTVEDVTGSPFRGFVHPEDIPVCEAAFAEVRSSGKRVSGIEYRVLHANGSIRIHTSSVAPIFNEAGEAISYAGNAQDITERVQFQNAIKESNRKLNLLSSITRHDVANQLTVVQGYAQLAALRKPDPVIADFLTKISDSVEMIQHQFEFAKAYQDMGAQSPAWFRVGDVIESVKPPLLNLDCTCNSCEIFADPMVAKVFFNLFDNAMRYGKTVTTITVRCGKVDDELVITFADNGIGIPLNEKAKIFEKGFGKHTGFGLFLAREILAITGISILETGVHGKGARFEIAVPKGTYRSA